MQFQADGGNKHFISSIKFDLLLKRQESQLYEAINDVDHNNEKRVKAQSSTFNSNLLDLKVVAKERHILFIQDVKKVCEDVNFKLQELREDMGLEIAVLQQDYSSLHQKVDLIADVVTKFVKLYEALNTKVDKMASDDVHSFSNINQLLVELKGLALKTSLLSSSLITLELLFEMFLFLESTIQKELDPLSKLLTIMPTHVPPVFIGV